MSADSVDDLHNAEDALSRLGAEAAEAIKSGDIDAQLRVVGSLHGTRLGYCRPTCRAVDEGECQSDDPTCGCLCHGEF